MRVAKTLMVIAAMTALQLLAHDADTLAFYAFKEGDAGTSLSGKTLFNDAGDAFAGTVTINSGSIEYRADVPGAYVFGSESADDLLCSSPQSIHFSGDSTEGSQLVSFADLGTAVSSNDDFTVEFFFKYGEGDTGIYKKTIPLLAMECGLVYNPTTSTNPGAGEPGRFEIMNHGISGRYLDCYLVDRGDGQRTRFDTNGSVYYGQYLDDGLWHHIAVVYVAATSKFSVYLDYQCGYKKADVPRTTSHSVLATPEPLLIGNGGFRGIISCLRISKCARTETTFMRASNLQSYSPETVFHWSFDGENGTDAGTLASPLSADPRIGQYIERRAPRTGSGYVRTYTDGDTVVSPSYTNEIPLARRFVVKSGGREVAVSTNAIHLAVGGNFTGTGLRVSGTNYYPLVSGSWTIEGWFKMDYAAWKGKVVDAELNNKQATLFGLNYGNQWTQSDFALALFHQSDGFKLKLTAHDQVEDVSGVSLGTKFRDNAWHHAAVVYDDLTHVMTAYVDGQPILVNPLSKAFEPRTSEPYREYLVGWGTARQAFEGLVDEVRLVRRALQPSEFISFARPPSGMVLLFR